MLFPAKVEQTLRYDGLAAETILSAVVRLQETFIIVTQLLHLIPKGYHLLGIGEHDIDTQTPRG